MQTERETAGECGRLEEKEISWEPLFSTPLSFLSSRRVDYERARPPAIQSCVDTPRLLICTGDCIWLSICRCVVPLLHSHLAVCIYVDTHVSVYLSVDISIYIYMLGCVYGTRSGTRVDLPSIRAFFSSGVYTLGRLVSQLTAYHLSSVFFSPLPFFFSPLLVSSFFGSVVDGRKERNKFLF